MDETTPPDQDALADLEQAEQATSEAQTSQETTPSEAETIALRRGWLPKDQFKGPPEQWIDAEAFNERGENFAKTLKRKVSDLEKQLADFEGTKAAFAKFHADAIERKDRELQAAIKALKVQRSEAQSEGDHNLAVALEEEINNLDTERKAVNNVKVEQTAPTKLPPPDTDNPVIKEWIEDGNDWFNTRSDLRDYALSWANEAVQKSPSLRGRALLNAIRAHMEEEFPRTFRSKADKPSLNLTPPAGKSGKASTGRSAADLPAEDRALMQQFVKAGWITEAAFLAEYQWER